MMDIKEALARLETPESAKAPVTPECAIDVCFRLGDGRALAGTFHYCVPSTKERRHIAVVAATLRQGVPAEAFTPEALALIERDAYLAVCLRSSPDWAKSLDELLDPRIADQLYQEALAHEARFLGAGGHLGASSPESP